MITFLIVACYLLIAFFTSIGIKVFQTKSDDVLQAFAFFWPLGLIFLIFIAVAKIGDFITTKIANKIRLFLVKNESKNNNLPLE